MTDRLEVTEIGQAAQISAGFRQRMYEHHEPLTVIDAIIMLRVIGSPDIEDAWTDGMDASSPRVELAVEVAKSAINEVRGVEYV